MKFNIKHIYIFLLIAVTVLVPWLYVFFVQNEIQHAFKLVNEGLTTSSYGIDQKSDSLLKVINKAEGFDSVKLKAVAVRKLTIQYCAFIDSLKEEMIRRAGGRDGEENIVKRDDMDIATHLMIDEKQGDTLFAKMEGLKNKMVALVTDTATSYKVGGLLSIHTGRKNESPSYFVFNYVPVTAALTILTKLRNDAESVELIMYGAFIKEVESQ